MRTGCPVKTRLYLEKEIPNLTKKQAGTRVIYRMKTPPTKGPVTMRHFTLGLVLGSLFVGTLVSAGTFYDSKGKPNAPTGSIQSYDYYRQRQQWLDTQALRRHAEHDRLTDPCGR
jgi:hypothetical protein